MSDLESKRAKDKVCNDERKKIAKEIILRYLASPGVNRVEMNDLFKFCPILTGLDYIQALLEIEKTHDTIESTIDLDTEEPYWRLVANAQKIETPEFFDPVTRATLSGSLLHDGAVYLALENEYQKRRRKF